MIEVQKWDWMLWLVGRFCEILGVGSKNQNILATMVNPPALGFSCSDVPTPRVSFYSFAPSVTQSF